MYHLLLTFLLGLSATAALACKCLPQNLADHLASASQVFVGRAVRVNAEKSCCLFAVTQKFKGGLGDTLTIYSAPTSCGLGFEAGQAYVIFASRGQANRCDGSMPLAVSSDLGRLYATFRPSFADSLGRDTFPLLNRSEAFYFDSELQRQRGAFSFQAKRVAFFSNAAPSDKQRYVRGNPDGHPPASALLVLTPTERQQSGGYDAIIVVARKQGISPGFRRRLVGRLGRPAS